MKAIKGIAAHRTSKQTSYPLNLWRSYMAKSFRMKILAIIALVMLFSFQIASCGTVNRGKSNREPTGDTTATNKFPASPTLENSPTPTITPYPTSIPTITPIPTRTPTSTPSPTPEPVQINAANLDRIQLMEEVGKTTAVGSIFKVSVSLEGKKALIFGESVMVYAFETEKEEIFEGEYQQAALSPDGSSLALAGSDQMIEIFPLEGDQSPIQLQGHYTDVEALTWSPDGERIVGYNQETGLLIWNPINGKLLKNFSFPVEENLWYDPVQLNWSPDSQFVGLAGIDQNVRIVAGDELITLKGFEGPVTHLDWSPDGTRLAASSTNAPTVIIWRTSNWNKILRIANHQYWVSNVAWSPDGKYLATADASGTAFIRDPNSGSTIHYFTNQDSPELISWSPDGNYLLELFYDGFNIYDVGMQESIEVPEAILGGVELISWIPGSERLLISNTDSRVQLWDLVTGEVEMLINPEIGNIVALAWSPDGNRLALGENGGGILLYDYAQRRLTKATKKSYPFINSLSWSPDGKAIAVADDRRIAIIEVATGEEQLSFEDGSWMYVLGWSYPGGFILTGNWDGMISLWDPLTGKRIDRWNPLRGRIREVNFSPDYERAILLTNRSITLWDTGQGKQIKSVQYNMDTYTNMVQWSPDGSQFALVVEDFSDFSGIPLISLHYLDAETLEDKQVIQFENGTYTPYSPSDISWSPDGSLLALNSGEIRDGKTGEVLHTIEEGVRVTWSPDGYALILIKGSMEIWQVNPVAP
jgi:WD40 repeat protein